MRLHPEFWLSRIEEVLGAFFQGVVQADLAALAKLTADFSSPTPLRGDDNGLNYQTHDFDYDDISVSCFVVLCHRAITPLTVKPAWKDGTSGHGTKADKDTDHTPTRSTPLK